MSKPKLSSLSQVLLSRRLWATAPLLAPALAGANPTGGSVTGGTATITNTDSHTVTVTQGSHRAIINWQTFSVGHDEYVVFNQPTSSAVALNRVVGQSASEIFGTIKANGRVFLINPQGVLFAPGSKIDVGALVASTQNITDSDFLNGKYVFSGDSTAPVTNAGNITAARNGFVVLAGDYVKNTGVVQATAGKIVMAAGNAFTLTMNDNGLVSYQVDQAALSDKAGVENLGKLLADGGQVIMTAEVAHQLTTTVVNNAGLIQARGITQDAAGDIELIGEGGDVSNTGTLDASGVKGGTVHVLGDRNVTLGDKSRILASGTSKGSQGGSVRIVGEGNTLFARGAQIDATGKSGGGFVELSGHGALLVRGALKLGKGGRLMIDPTNLTIADGGGANNSYGSNATVSEQFVEGQLRSGANVTLVATNNITVEDLHDNELNGHADGNKGGSLTIGIGTFTYGGSATNLGYGVGASTGDGSLQFVRGTGNGYGNITFLDTHDSVRVDGSLRLFGGSQYGAITAGNLVAGGSVDVIAYGDAHMGNVQAGGNVYGDAAYGTLITGNVNADGSVFLSGYNGVQAGNITGINEVSVRAQYGSITVDDVTVTADDGDNASFYGYAGYGGFSAQDISVVSRDGRASAGVYAEAPGRGNIEIDSLTVSGNAAGDASSDHGDLLAFADVHGAGDVAVHKLSVSTRNVSRDSGSHAYAQAFVYAGHNAYVGDVGGVSIVGYGRAGLNVGADGDVEFGKLTVNARNGTHHFSHSNETSSGQSDVAYGRANVFITGYGSLDGYGDIDFNDAVAITGNGGAALQAFTRGTIRVHSSIKVDGGHATYKGSSTSLGDGTIEKWHGQSGSAALALTGGDGVQVDKGKTVTVTADGSAEAAFYGSDVDIEGTVNVVAGQATSVNDSTSISGEGRYHSDSAYGVARLNIGAANVTIGSDAHVLVRGSGGGSGRRINALSYGPSPDAAATLDIGASSSVNILGDVKVIADRGHHGSSSFHWNSSESRFKNTADGGTARMTVMTDGGYGYGAINVGEDATIQVIGHGGAHLGLNIGSSDGKNKNFSPVLGSSFGTGDLRIEGDIRVEAGGSDSKSESTYGNGYGGVTTFADSSHFGRATFAGYGGQGHVVVTDTSTITVTGDGAAHAELLSYGNGVVMTTFAQAASVPGVVFDGSLLVDGRGGHGKGEQTVRNSYGDIVSHNKGDGDGGGASVLIDATGSSGDVTIGEGASVTVHGAGRNGPESGASLEIFASSNVQIAGDLSVIADVGHSHFSSEYSNLDGNGYGTRGHYAFEGSSGSAGLDVGAGSSIEVSGKVSVRGNGGAFATFDAGSDLTLSGPITIDGGAGHQSYVFESSYSGFSSDAGTRTTFDSSGAYSNDSRQGTARLEALGEGTVSISGPLKVSANGYASLAIGSGTSGDVYGSEALRISGPVTVTAGPGSEKIHSRQMSHVVHEYGSGESFSSGSAKNLVDFRAAYVYGGASVDIAASDINLNGASLTVSGAGFANLDISASGSIGAHNITLAASDGPVKLGTINVSSGRGQIDYGFTSSETQAHDGETVLDQETTYALQSAYGSAYVDVFATGDITLGAITVRADGYAVASFQAGSSEGSSAALSLNGPITVDGGNGHISLSYAQSSFEGTDSNYSRSSYAFEVDETVGLAELGAFGKNAVSISGPVKVTGRGEALFYVGGSSEGSDSESVRITGPVTVTADPISANVHIHQVYAGASSTEDSSSEHQVTLDERINLAYGAAGVDIEGSSVNLGGATITVSGAGYAGLNISASDGSINGHGLALASGDSDVASIRVDSGAPSYSMIISQDQRSRSSSIDGSDSSHSVTRTEGHYGIGYAVVDLDGYSGVHVGNVTVHGAGDAYLGVLTGFSNSSADVSMGDIEVIADNASNSYATTTTSTIPVVTADGLTIKAVSTETTSFSSVSPGDGAQVEIEAYSGVETGDITVRGAERASLDVFTGRGGISVGNVNVTATGAHRFQGSHDGAYESSDGGGATVDITTASDSGSISFRKIKVDGAGYAGLAVYGGGIYGGDVSVTDHGGDFRQVNSYGGVNQGHGGSAYVFMVGNSSGSGSIDIGKVTVQADHASHRFAPGQNSYGTASSEVLDPSESTLAIYGVRARTGGIQVRGDVAHIAVGGDQGEVNVDGDFNVDVTTRIDNFFDSGISGTHDSTFGSNDLRAHNVRLQVAGDSEGEIDLSGGFESGVRSGFSADKRISVISTGDIYVKGMGMYASDGIVSLVAGEEIADGGFSDPSDTAWINAGGLGVAAGSIIDLTHTQFEVDNGKAPFGSDPLLKLWLKLGHVKFGSIDPNAAFAAPTIRITADKFHGGDGSDTNVNTDFNGDGKTFSHIYFRGDRLDFGSDNVANTFDVGDNILVRFDTYTKDAPIFIEQQFDGGTLPGELDVGVANILDRFPGPNFVFGNSLSFSDVFIGNNAGHPLDLSAHGGTDTEGVDKFVFITNGDVTGTENLDNPADGIISANSVAVLQPVALLHAQVNPSVFTTGTTDHPDYVEDAGFTHDLPGSNAPVEVQTNGAVTLECK